MPIQVYRTVLKAFWLKSNSNRTKLAKRLSVSQDTDKRFLLGLIHLDAAHLYRLALEKAQAGSRLYGCAEEGVPFRDIASVIGKHLNLLVVSISREEADAHFGFLGAIASLDIPSALPGSGVVTQELLDWRPVHPRLIADFD